MRRKQKYRPLAPAELAICERVRQVRKLELAPQAAFARVIGLSRDQLASIESGRVPLRFENGWRLCQLMHLNPLWLAFGESDWQTTFAPFGFGPIQPSTRFSEVMSIHREQYRATLETHLREMLDPSKAAKERELWDQLLLSWGIYLSELDAAKLQHQVKWAAAIFPVVKNSLTIVPDMFDALVSMKAVRPAISRWKQLQRRLQVATRQRGAKAALARHLDVDRQIVTEWLKHATRGPSADTALRLLEWVEAAKAQQKKSAGRVSETRRRKATRTRKSKDEKPSSDRKKH